MQGQGLDYRAIGTAQGVSQAAGIYEVTIRRWQAHAEDLERRLRLAEAEADARDAGRTAQLSALERAMLVTSPFDPILAPTGRVYEDGTPERLFEAEFPYAYDDVGRRHGLPRSRDAMRPEEWADARAAAVLAEPIVVNGWWLWERILWRGIQYRSVRVAERARADEARRAREGSGS